MIKRKLIRERGKIRLSDYFKKFKEGDKVSVKREFGFGASFPKVLQGRSGSIKGKRGRYYFVKINDMNLEKVYLIHPVHLKKV